MNNRLANQAYWDSINRDYPLQAAGPKDGVWKWLQQTIRSQNITCGRCFEVGCYPGRYLPLFGRQGLELNGIDLTPQVSDKLPAWLRSQGLSVGKFYCEDFEIFDISERYDVVFSIGFIEHFKDWKTVLKKQAKYVAKGGWLIVCVPNFRGVVQRLLHQYLDLENLNRHNLESMKLKRWKQVTDAIGLRHVFSGYFGGFDFWVEKKRRTAFEQNVLKMIARSLPLLRQLMPDSKLYSPYCGLVAKRE